MISCCMSHTLYFKQWPGDVHRPTPRYKRVQQVACNMLYYAKYEAYEIWSLLVFQQLVVCRFAHLLDSHLTSNTYTLNVAHVKMETGHISKASMLMTCLASAIGHDKTRHLPGHFVKLQLMETNFTQVDQTTGAALSCLSPAHQSALLLSYLDSWMQTSPSCLGDREVSLCWLSVIPACYDQCTHCCKYTILGNLVCPHCKMQQYGTTADFCWVLWRYADAMT